MSTPTAQPLTLVSASAVAGSSSAGSPITAASSTSKWRFASFGQSTGPALGGRKDAAGFREVERFRWAGVAELGDVVGIVAADTGDCARACEADEGGHSSFLLFFFLFPIFQRSGSEVDRRKGEVK
jgi:hypothetical protein